MKEFKNIKEILELADDELIKNNKETFATLDYEDLVELKELYNGYKEELENNFKRSDMIFCLKAENTELKDRIKTLGNADLTSVYIDGVYDGEKKFKSKIKEKIEELQELLEKEDNTNE